MEALEVKLSERMGCYSKDRIIISVSPTELEEVEEQFEKLAMKAENYISQGIYRKIKDDCYNGMARWRKERDEE